MTENATKWNADMRHVLGQRFGGTFGRAGIETPGNLVKAIKNWGLYYNATTGLACFFGDGARQVRGAGPKTWGAALKLLDELGFPWRDYICTPRLGRKRPLAAPCWYARLSRQIADLTQLLKSFQSWCETQSDD